MEQHIEKQITLMDTFANFLFSSEKINNMDQKSCLMKFDRKFWYIFYIFSSRSFIKNAEWLMLNSAQYRTYW